MRKAFLGILGLAITACALMAPMASAANEQLKIREFYPGGNAGGSYIVLQAYAPGQNHLAGHTLRWYLQPPTNPYPGIEKTFTFPSDVANGESQRTILIADTSYSGSVAPDFTVPELTLYPGTGNICLDPRNEPPPIYTFVPTDCVNWGGGGGAGPEPGYGYPAFQLQGVPAGKAGRRSIGLGCPTLLEGRDDTEQGENDWFSAPPNPRNNASPILETPCNPPSSGINSASVEEGETTGDTSVRIAFAASPFVETTYECNLDGAGFETCTSPTEYEGLGEGPHTFEVRAANANGVEQTPASLSWTVGTASTLLSTGGEESATAAATSAAPAALAAAPATRSAAAPAAALSAPAPSRTSSRKKHRKHRAHRRHPRKR